MNCCRFFVHKISPRDFPIHPSTHLLLGMQPCCCWYTADYSEVDSQIQDHDTWREKFLQGFLPKYVQGTAGIYCSEVYIGFYLSSVKLLLLVDSH